MNEPDGLNETAAEGIVSTHKKPGKCVFFPHRFAVGYDP